MSKTTGLDPGRDRKRQTLHWARHWIAVLALCVSCGGVTPAPEASSNPPGRSLDAGETLYFDTITEPGHRGREALVHVRTVPGVQCRAVFLWPGMPSGGQVVPAASSDANGLVVLRWPIDPRTPPGAWRIEATCGGRLVSTHVPID